ncbi:MAG: hypothetical protein AB8C84_00365, partial [Oligoflexales bacterium]
LPMNLYLCTVSLLDPLCDLTFKFTKFPYSSIEGGVEKLVNDHYIGRVSLLNQEQIEILQDDLGSKIFPTTDAVIAHA